MKPPLNALIRQGREKAGLTRAELANLLGVSPAAVTYWESGQKTPSGDLTIELIRLLNLVQDCFPDSFPPKPFSDQKISLENRVAVIEGVLFNQKNQTAQ